MEKKSEKIKRRKLGIRSKIGGEGYRLSVFRSNKNLFAQIIDLKTGKTVLGILDKKKDFLDKKSAGLPKKEKAMVFGEMFAKEALTKKIKEVKFDRSGYLFHGRIKAFAEGAKKGGLNF